MTPKKIYINQSEFDLKGVYLASRNSTIHGLNASDKEETYILESEHNRIVEELKSENEKLKFDLEYVSGVANDLLNSGKWVSVEERMPEYDTPILAHTLKGSTFQCSRDKEIDLDSFELYLEDDKVTHWMPLPHPPTEK